MLRLHEEELGCSTDESGVSTEWSKIFRPLPTEHVEPMAANSEAFQRACRRGGSRYRGVVPQPNGRWGAQIYENNQRIWLGTYDDEDGAAKAYDVAAQCFRGQEFATFNFFGAHKAEEDCDLEAKFLRSHPKEEIVDMLRTHTYDDELERMKQSSRAAACAPRRMLFQKTVTPSDVGRQNRLVIPKKHAEKHFPTQITRQSSRVLVVSNSRHHQPGNPTTQRAKTGNMLNFRDMDGGRVWRFRFSYWNRSRSYVLTRGWSRFVKEKRLEAGDTVSFQQSTGPDKRLYIHYDKPTTAGIRPEHPAHQVVRLFGVNICPPGSEGRSRSAIHRGS